MQRSLALLAFLCLALFFSSGGKAQKPLDEGQQKRIGISSQQSKDLDALFSASHRQRQAIRSRLRDLYRDLHKLYDSYDLDQKRTDAVRKEIGAQQQQLMDIYLDNETKLRRILTRDQFERLRAQMKAERERHRGEHPAQAANEGRPHP